MKMGLIVLLVLLNLLIFLHFSRDQLQSNQAHLPEIGADKLNLISEQDALSLSSTATESSQADAESP